MSVPSIREPDLTVLQTDFRTNGSVVVDSVMFGSGGLKIRVESDEWRVQVVYKTLCGFRVLDELDLTEFWPKAALRDGWLFQVHAGGWLELELRRPNFVSGRLYNLSEFLIIGLNECVSVLSEEPPVIQVSPSNQSVRDFPSIPAA